MFGNTSSLFNNQQKDLSNVFGSANTNKTKPPIHNLNNLTLTNPPQNPKSVFEPILNPENPFSKMSKQSDKADLTPPPPSKNNITNFLSSGYTSNQTLISGTKSSTLSSNAKQTDQSGNSLFASKPNNSATRTTLELEDNHSGGIFGAKPSNSQAKGNSSLLSNGNGLFGKAPQKPSEEFGLFGNSNKISSQSSDTKTTFFRNSTNEENTAKSNIFDKNSVLEVPFFKTSTNNEFCLLQSNPQIPNEKKNIFAVTDNIKADSPSIFSNNLFSKPCSMFGIDKSQADTYQPVSTGLFTSSFGMNSSSQPPTRPLFSSNLQVPISTKLNSNIFNSISFTSTTQKSSFLNQNLTESVLQTNSLQNEKKKNIAKQNDELKSLAPIEKIPILNRNNCYKTTPDFISICRMSEEELKNVNNFSIYNQFGRIDFEGVTDLSNLNLDRIVTIKEKLINLYQNDLDLNPTVGEGLNKPAVVHMYECFPNSDEASSIYITSLLKTCTVKGVFYI